MEFDKNLPVYWQIIEIVKIRILREEYLPGHMVPTVRILADEFGVTSNTMQRAYVELVRDGLLISMRGMGYKVTEEKRLLNKFRRDFINERFTKLHHDMKGINISDVELCHLFDEFINRKEIEK
jgi:GntR family transcriptional regulator